jgi:hypothetical protein
MALNDRELSGKMITKKTKAIVENIARTDKFAMNMALIVDLLL